MALSASCFRMGAIRFCLAMILGLLLVSGYVVAPVLFAKAESSMLAGMLAGHIFHVANAGVIFLVAAVAAFWIRLGGVGRLNWILLLLVAVFVAGNEFILSPMMQALKDAAGAMDALPKDDPQRMQFAMYHGVSAVLHLIASGMAVLLVALGGNACTSYQEAK